MKIVCLFLSLIGIVRLEMLAYNAIVFLFIWCGVPHMKRQNEVLLYYLLAPVVLFCLLRVWKNPSLLDRVVRISCMSFLGAMLVYWFFEFSNWGCWITFW